MRQLALRSLVFMPFAVGLGMLAASTSACSTGPDGSARSSEGSSPTVSEPVSVDASTETREELGVVVWGATSSDDGTSATFVGYDSQGKKKVTVTQSTTVTDEDHHELVIEVRGDKKHSGRMKMENVVRAPEEPSADEPDAREIHLEVTENTLADSAGGNSVLDRISDDFENVTETSSSLTRPTAWVIPGQIAPLANQALTKGDCLPLVKECGKQIYKFAKPLKGCAKLAVRAGIVLLCSVGGFIVADVPGAVAAGRKCFQKQAPKGAMDALDCAKNAKDIYENWNDRIDGMKKDCGAAKQGCSSDKAQSPTETPNQGSTPAPAPKEEGPLTSSRSPL